MNFEEYGLHSEDLEAIEFKNDEDWLNKRTLGIGGSDAGAILGLNKYESPLQVYKAKVEGVKKDLSDNPFVKKGKVLEQLIRNEYVRPYLATKGYTVKQVPFMIRNTKMPWLIANIDGIAVKEGKLDDTLGIEIKWVSGYAESNWDGEDYNGIPASYYAQVQHYMTVTGCKWWLVCALFDDEWEMHYYLIRKDYTFIDSKLVPETKKFYEINMQMKIAPILKTEIDKEALAELSMKDVTDDKLTSDESMDKDIEQYLDLQAKTSKLNKELSTVKDVIVNKYAKGSRPINHTVRLTNITSARFDSSKFKEEHEDLYKQYVTQCDSVRTTIK